MFAEETRWMQRSSGDRLQLTEETVSRLQRLAVSRPPLPLCFDALVPSEPVGGEMRLRRKIGRYHWRHERCLRCLPANYGDNAGPRG